MIPKRKDDGSLILKYSSSAAQPAQSSSTSIFEGGCTAQCLSTLLNVIEDFQTRKKTDKTAALFLLAYDQAKAYDSVQAYTIKASLERFNLPSEFISYVLSNLEEATSCFKTFYGPTEEFSIETSVRQGDPLSPLIYKPFV